MGALIVRAIFAESTIDPEPILRPVLGWAIRNRFIDMPPIEIFRVADYGHSVRAANSAAWAYIRNLGKES